MQKTIFVKVWRTYLFLVACLCAHVANAGTPVQPTEVEYPIPVWVVRAGRNGFCLPQIGYPLEYTFRVRSGNMVHVGGYLASASATNYSERARSGIFLIKFLDANHNEVAIKATTGLDAIAWPNLKGYYSYLQGSTSPCPFYFEIEVPENAVEGKVSLARMNPKSDNVLLTGFSCVVAEPTHALRDVVLVYCLFVFSLVAAWFSRKTKGSSCELMADVKSSVQSRIAKLWKLGVATLAIVMACIFFRETYIAIGRYPDFISMVGILIYVMVLILLASLVYFVASGRIGLSITIIMSLCFMAHVIVIRLTHSLYPQTMFSDYLQVEMMMKSPAIGIRHTTIFYWANYELLCSFLSKLFCSDIRVAQYLNAVCCTAAVYPVFKLSHRIGGHKIAVLTSLLMALSPVTQLYGTLLTGEFIAAAAYSWAVYFIVLLLDEELVSRKCFYALLCGIFLGLGNFMKPFAIIFIVATIMIVAYDFIKTRYRIGIKWLVVLPVLFGSYSLVYKSGQHIVKEIVKPQILEISEGKVLAGTLLIGLHAETHGRVDSKWVRQWGHLPFEGRMSLLKQMIKKDYRKLPALFLEKLDYTYSDPRLFWAWYGLTIKAEVASWVRSYVCIWNFMVLFLVAVGILGFILSGNIGNNKGFLGMVSILVVAAFTVTVLLTEAQPRYKVAIYPVFFFLISYARFLFEKDGLLCKWLKHCMAVAVIGLRSMRTRKSSAKVCNGREPGSF